MTNEEERRFQTLSSGPCVSIEYVQGYYGLPWPLGPQTATILQRYQNGLRRQANCSSDRVSRHELEGFLVRSDVLPRKWMAARLGMTPPSLNQLLPGLEVVGMLRGRYEVGAEFVGESLSEDLIRNLPGLRSRTFADHDDFCERLHDELRKEMHVPIDPLFCKTSERMDEHPRRFARHFDCITLEPLSTKHSLWLDFRKPLTFPPDRCSKLFYAENREALLPFAAGRGDPDDLEQYEQFLMSSRNG